MILLLFSASLAAGCLVVGVVVVDFGSVVVVLGLFSSLDVVVDLAEVDFAGFDLVGVDLAGVDLAGVDLALVDLAGAGAFD